MARPKKTAEEKAQALADRREKRERLREERAERLRARLVARLRELVEAGGVFREETLSEQVASVVDDYQWSVAQVTLELHRLRLDRRVMYTRSKANGVCVIAWVLGDGGQQVRPTKERKPRSDKGVATARRAPSAQLGLFDELVTKDGGSHGST